MDCGNSTNDADLDAYLSQLTPSERAEALAAAAAAQRAEARAEQRALERALREKEAQRRSQQTESTNVFRNDVASEQRLVYIPKRKREQMSSLALDNEPQEKRFLKTALHSDMNGPNLVKSRQIAAASDVSSSSNGTTVLKPSLTEKERLAVIQTYLGKSATEVVQQEEDAYMQKRKQSKSNKKATFKFRWDETDDTSNLDDPIYMAPLQRPALERTRPKGQKLQKIMGASGDISNMMTVMQKPIHQMNARDWRILRENYEISVRGGQAPPPMRSFAESPSPHLPQLHPSLLDAIGNVLRFKEPSPIQRQAIPIGLQRRDLIGISETGSGKTVAFGVPMCHYLLNLPKAVLESVADQGPLALVMAPTRELALQIEVELSKLLSRQRVIQSIAVVGGQAIQQQAQMIRRGVHIIVGTPGRINECIEMAYLVLNQCCYIVMDEADRMIDMGFAPQMESILDAMGGALKSNDESEAYQQELEDLATVGVARHRVTVMFSATMPLEMERIAKQYLRHPSIVTIGDKNSSKNARIVQKLVWLSTPAKKEEALRDLLRDPRFLRDKVIVFVNEKKHADSVGRMVERSGRQCVVLHGGKSQDQREENLETFRRGGVVMVATDVAGRGLDIPDVAHVINYDLPTRSIENYTHRIGRTGRAGKEGLATSLITDEDEGIMAALRSYLESTGNQVPDRLARHAAASSVSTTNDIMY